MKYNKDIEIQQPTKTKDTDGSERCTWGTFLATYAAIITTGGREFYAAQKMNAETTAVFEMWFCAGIKTTMRVKYYDYNEIKYFDILYTNNVNGENQKIQLYCKEVI